MPSIDFQKLFVRVNRDIALLAPVVQQKMTTALANANEAGYSLEMFEGYRTWERQGQLFSQGRTTPGKVVTKASPGYSFHQYGLAFDVAYKVGGKWTWEGDFDKPAQYFLDEGFEWLSPFEKGHFQLTGGMSIGEVRKLAREQGTPGLWLAIKELASSSS